MQISTRKEDFIVDTLALRSSLHLLNESFTDPNVVKVFHGAEMDMQWLQKDFGVYVVNLFDTYHASHLLSLEAHSLAFLLKYFCDVETDKTFQTSDWRIRPLPEKMMKYARMDTHYLLYIFDRMKNALISTSNETLNLLRVTLERSALTSLKLYKKEAYSDDGLGINGWKTLLSRSTAGFNEENVAVFKAVHSWRDHTARKEDESLRYVLPNHMMQTIARVMPKDSTAVLACCQPSAPVLVRLYAKELASLIEHTLEEFRSSNATRSKKEQTRVLEEKEQKAKAEALRGPVHVHFDDSAYSATHATKQAETDNVALPVAPTRNWDISKVVVSKSSKSVLFSFQSIARPADKVAAKAMKKADGIRKGLVLQAPSFPNEDAFVSMIETNGESIEFKGEQVAQPPEKYTPSKVTIDADPFKNSEELLKVDMSDSDEIEHITENPKKRMHKSEHESKSKKKKGKKNKQKN